MIGGVLEEAMVSGGADHRHLKRLLTGGVNGLIEGYLSRQVDSVTYSAALAWKRVESMVSDRFRLKLEKLDEEELSLMFVDAMAKVMLAPHAHKRQISAFEEEWKIRFSKMDLFPFGADVLFEEAYGGRPRQEDDEEESDDSEEE
jgi:hypothetical protein